MDWKDQLKELWNRLTWSSTAGFELPGVLFEIQPDFVMGARLAGNGGGRAQGQAQFGRLAMEPLAPGTIAPALAGPSILNRDKLAAALRDVALRVGNGSAPVGLLVPDGLARVGILPLEALPANRREAATLIGWNLRDGLPFPPDEARITYQSLPEAEPGRIELVAVAARTSVLAEYESLLEAVSRSSSLLLPASLALLPLLEAEGPTLLVHVYGSAATLAVAHGQHLRFWRTRDFEELEPREFLAQVAAEAARVLASSADRFGISVESVRLCTRPPAGREWIPELAQILGCRVESLEPAAEAGGLLSTEERSLLGRYGATLAGLAANH
jgi:hypothetical protein